MVSLFIITLIGFTAWQYFIYWGKNQNVYDAFSGNYVMQAQYLKGLDAEIPKYVILNASGVDIRGLPAPAETLIFLTGGWNEAYRSKHNIHLVREDEFENLQARPGAIFILIQESNEWTKRIKTRFPEASRIVNNQFSAFSI